MARSLESLAGSPPRGGSHALTPVVRPGRLGETEKAADLYERAIRCARDNGFVHNEALAYELASRFHRARGFDSFAELYLREARARYARWGADSKVKQIDQQYPRVLEPTAIALTASVAVPAEQLDLLSVIKASQTISGEIVPVGVTRLA